jgi:hypothetical protein
LPACKVQRTSSRTIEENSKLKTQNPKLFTSPA